MNPSLITSDSRSGASHGRGIVFVTNSKPYLDALIPQKYQILCDTATNDFTIALQDKSLIAFGKAPQPQAIIVDIDDLQNISRHWLVIIPTLGGTPELVTRVNRAPVLWLPALEQIIKNIGHMSFYSLYEPLFDQIEDEQDDEQIDGGKYDDERPPEIVSRLGNAYLRPPTCVVRVIAYLEGEKTDNGIWPFRKRDEAIIRFLAQVEGWSSTLYSPHNALYFERQELERNLPLLSRDLSWFRDREERRKCEDIETEREKTERGRRARLDTLRKRRKAGEVTEVRKRARRGERGGN